MPGTIWSALHCCMPVAALLYVVGKSKKRKATCQDRSQSELDFLQPDSDRTVWKKKKTKKRKKMKDKVLQGVCLPLCTSAGASSSTRPQCKAKTQRGLRRATRPCSVCLRILAGALSKPSRTPSSAATTPLLRGRATLLCSFCPCAVSKVWSCERKRDSWRTRPKAWPLTSRPVVRTALRPGKTR